MALNRAMRRDLAHNGKLEQFMNDVYEREYEKVRKHAYIHAWSCMFLALVDRFPWMTDDVLHSIAVDTIDYANGIEPAHELAAKLKERTGFDIFVAPHEDAEHSYIEKGAPDHVD